MRKVRLYSLYIAWVISLVGTMGSIYFGEMSQIEPCPICWYQRICLFPLSIILGIATYRLDSGIKIYVLPQIFIGATIACWQFLEKKVSWLASPVLCSWQGECGEKIYTIMGISFPLLSFLAFVLIFLFLLISPKGYIGSKNV